jgi:hypothetical protein
MCANSSATLLVARWRKIICARKRSISKGAVFIYSLSLSAACVAGCIVSCVARFFSSNFNAAQAPQRTPESGGEAGLLLPLLIFSKHRLDARRVESKSTTLPLVPASHFAHAGSPASWSLCRYNHCPINKMLLRRVGGWSTMEPPPRPGHYYLFLPAAALVVKRAQPIYAHTPARKTKIKFLMRLSSRFKHGNFTF